MRRIHRTMVERISYLAIFQCLVCEREQQVPRPFHLRFGPHARCPKCGTYRLTRLGEPDGIDPIQGGFLNLIERLRHGNLFHCRFCRVQFYDRRPLRTTAPEPPPAPVARGAPT